MPVRAGRFIARKNWIVAGSDDFQLRVYNYNTSEKVTSFEAHPDYIRAIAVHPTQPFVLTASVRGGLPVETNSADTVAG